MDSYCENLQQWLKLQKECKTTMETIGKAKAKLSYTTSATLESTMPTISSSRVQLCIYDEINELMEHLQRLQERMVHCLEEMERVTTTDQASLLIDVSLLRSVHEKLMQQTTLEKALAAKIVDLDVKDQDSLVTMLACFTYLPCVSSTDIDHLLHFRN